MTKKDEDSGSITVTVTDSARDHQQARVAMEAVAKAEQAAEKLPKLPKEVSQKRLSNLQDSIISAQRKAIESLLVVLRDKDLFISGWTKWVASIRECSESVREAEKMLRNLDNRRMAELEKALDAALKESVAQKNEVEQLKVRIKHLLGK